MPRQAARLVLGRSVRSTKTPPELSSSSRLQLFSTTPRRWADLDGANNNNNAGSNDGSNNDRGDSGNFRRIRQVRAASALGAMTRPGEDRPAASHRGGSNYLSRPSSLGGRPGNIISMKSLPNRGDGAPRQLIGRAGRFGGGPGDRSSSPGASDPAPRFAGRSGADGFRGPRRGGPGRGGGFFRGGARGRGRGGGGFRGGRGGPRGGRGAPRGGRGRVRRGGASGPRKPRDEGQGGTEDLEFEDLIGMPLAEGIQEHVRVADEAGPVRSYKPSTTLESLIGWGPAVATNTALGQVETAVRSMRIMGGGRAYSELEQSFRITDLRRWTSAGKPIMYTRAEQKEASLRMMDPQEGERMTEKRIQERIEKLKAKYGTDYNGFVKAFKALGSVTEQWERSTEKVENILASRATSPKKTKNETTKEAIIKYGIKGDHPEVEYAEDTWGKLARYYAHGPTYRPADAAKFDEKVRSLVRT